MTMTISDARDCIADIEKTVESLGYKTLDLVLRVPGFAEDFAWLHISVQPLNSASYAKQQMRAIHVESAAKLPEALADLSQWAVNLPDVQKERRRQFLSRMDELAQEAETLGIGEAVDLMDLGQATTFADAIRRLIRQQTENIITHEAD